MDTLFRGNTIACKVLSIAFKTFGLYYLQAVLRPMILNLMKTLDCDYEVDPTRLQDPSKLQANRTRLLDVVTSFYETILNSLPSLPLQLRTVCHILYQVTDPLDVICIPDPSCEAYWILCMGTFMCIYFITGPLIYCSCAGGGGAVP